jgi:hypothetical protein
MLVNHYAGLGRCKGGGEEEEMNVAVRARQRDRREQSQRSKEGGEMEMLSAKISPQVRRFVGVGGGGFDNCIWS